MIGLLITLAILTGYGLIGALVGAKLWTALCRYGCKTDCYMGHPFAVVAGVFWPVCMWVLFGLAVVRRDAARIAKRKADDEELERFRREAMKELS